MKNSPQRSDQLLIKAQLSLMFDILDLNYHPLQAISALIRDNTNTKNQASRSIISCGATLRYPSADFYFYSPPQLAALLTFPSCLQLMLRWLIIYSPFFSKLKMEISDLINKNPKARRQSKAMGMLGNLQLASLGVQFQKSKVRRKFDLVKI